MGGCRNPPFFMRQKNIELKIRKDNLYVLVNSYKITTLLLDLEESSVSLEVEFYRDGLFIIKRKYDFGEKGDIDVNELINKLHERIENGL